MTLRGRLRPQIRIRARAQAMTFTPGSVHTAHILTRNPTEAAWDYRIELSAWPAAASPSWGPSLHLEPGQEAILDIALTIPEAEGDYPLKLKAWVGEEYLGEFSVAVASVVAPVMLDADQVLKVMSYVYWWPTDEWANQLAQQWGQRGYTPHQPTDQWQKTVGDYYAPSTVDIEWKRVVFADYKFWFLGRVEYGGQWSKLAPISAADLIASWGDKMRWAIENLL